MKNFRLLLLFCLLFCQVHSARAQTGKLQTTQSNQWILSLFLGRSLPISASMQGTLEEFTQQTRLDAPQQTFPFGGAEPQQEYSIGFTASYHLSDSPWGFYSTGSVHNMSTSNQNSATTSTIAYNLAITSLALGGEYTAGGDALNVFWRLGLTVSVVNGYEMLATIYEFKPTFRGGLQTLLGMRYQFRGVPFGFELSAGYTNINLLGKSYSNPPTYQERLQEENEPRTLELNDGQSTPGTGTRTIDFLSVNAGLFLPL